MLADNTTGGKAAYGVVSALVVILYIAVLVLVGRRKNKSEVLGTAEGRGVEKGTELSSPVGSQDEVGGGRARGAGQSELA